MKQFLTGFTLIELMISIVIMGVLTVMAMPSIRSTESIEDKAVCIDHLRQIQWAKRRWVEQHANDPTPPTGTTVPADAAILGAAGWIPAYTCPSAGTYTVRAINQTPTCTTAGHVMP